MLVNRAPRRSINLLFAIYNGGSSKVGLLSVQEMALLSPGELANFIFKNYKFIISF